MIFVLLSFLPLLFHFSYLLQAWRSSRLDQWDWIFYLAGIPAAIWVLRKETLGKCDYRALFLLIPMLCFTAGGRIHHINALLIFSAVGVIFSVIWLLGSWPVAYRILPPAVILLLESVCNCLSVARSHTLCLASKPRDVDGTDCGDDKSQRLHIRKNGQGR